MCRIYVFAFCSLICANNGKLRPPSRQLFALNIFWLHKKRLFWPLNGLFRPFDFSFFRSLKVNISYIDQKMKKVFDYSILEFYPLQLLFNKVGCATKFFRTAIPIADWLSLSHFYRFKRNSLLRNKKSPL